MKELLKSKEMDSETEVRVHGNVVSNGDGGCPESIQQRHSVLVRRGDNTGGGSEEENTGLCTSW